MRSNGPPSTPTSTRRHSAPCCLHARCARSPSPRGCGAAVRRLLTALALTLMAPALTLIARQTPAPQPPAFRSRVNLVLVDVVVRDKSGAVVKGRPADEFEVLEDGVKQPIATFAYDEVRADAAPVEHASALPSAGAPASSMAAPAADATLPSRPLTSDEAAGHRLITLLFDTSSMEPDDVQKAIDGAAAWVQERMTPADLVAGARLG